MFFFMQSVFLAPSQAKTCGRALVTQLKATVASDEFKKFPTLVAQWTRFAEEKATPDPAQSNRNAVFFWCVALA